jgi:hypothetical protein
MKTKVYNLRSPRSDRPVANQYSVTTEKGEYFQSYKSMIACRPAEGGKIQLDENYWDYSATTLKYLKQWLNTTASKKEIQERIDSGQYELVDLN